jgi:hypothetical protein
MSIVARAIAVGLLFLLVVLSGISLSRAGRPLNVGISTIHKLISLATGAYLLVTVVQRNRQAPLGPAEWIAVVVTGLCFLVLVATGGFLASDKSMPVALLRIHQIMPVLTVLASGTTLYLLLA